MRSQSRRLSTLCGSGRWQKAVALRRASSASLHSAPSNATSPGGGKERGSGPPGRPGVGVLWGRGKSPGLHLSDSPGRLREKDSRPSPQSPGGGSGHGGCGPGPRRCWPSSDALWGIAPGPILFAPGLPHIWYLSSSGPTCALRALHVQSALRVLGTIYSWFPALLHDALTCSPVAARSCDLKAQASVLLCPPLA